MKQKLRNLLKNSLFLLLMQAVVAHTAMTAVILATLQVPHEAILDSGLDEIILVFEEDALGEEYICYDDKLSHIKVDSTCS